MLTALERAKGAEVIAAVAKQVGVTVADITGPSRLRRDTYARQLTTYLLRKKGWTFAEITSELHRQLATSAYSIRKIERAIDGGLNPEMEADVKALIDA